LIALHRVGVACLYAIGILTEFLASAPLAQQVPATVKLDFDRLKPRVVLLVEALISPGAQKSMLLVYQLFNLVLYDLVVHFVPYESKLTHSQACGCFAGPTPSVSREADTGCEADESSRGALCYRGLSLG
jgi:hypothetical protein